MAFNMIQYRDDLEQQLVRVAPVYRACFALWCLQAMLSDYATHIAKGLTKADADYINDRVHCLWHCAISGQLQCESELEGLVNRSNEAQIDDSDVLTGIVVAQLLGACTAVAEVFRTGSAHHAMLVADSCITCIDAQVSERDGVSPSHDLPAVPELASELHLQRRMIDYLNTSPAPQSIGLQQFRFAGA